ncbi:MAG TPA: HAD family hydrolase [Candidatus Scybalomonas excrementigallinarum]|jgi:phosphoglycolate phosphatase|nr:HAD family hydrolase [Candidatus Scybalomonas excrementigallinarum]
MSKQYILFDLDGTITDSGLGITKSVQYALRAMGIEEENLEALKVFIGPPLKESFMEFYHMTEEDAKKAVEKYREYYKEKGIFENQLYDGIIELLKDLKQEKKTILLATSKPEVFANQILEYFNIRQYFDYVAGAELHGPRNEKLDVMKYAMELAGIEDVKKAIMIGDRKFDMESAKELGMEGIGVLFGFGDKEELQKAGATYLVEVPSEIKELV